MDIIADCTEALKGNGTLDGLKFNKRQGHLPKFEGNLQNIYKFLNRISNFIPRWVRVIHLVHS